MRDYDNYAFTEDYRTFDVLPTEQLLRSCEDSDKQFNAVFESDRNTLETLEYALEESERDIRHYGIKPCFYLLEEITSFLAVAYTIRVETTSKFHITRFNINDSFNNNSDASHFYSCLDNGIVWTRPHKGVQNAL
jgi:hypothetical protein